MSDYQLVSQYEVARLVAKKMEKTDKNQVQQVYAGSENVVRVFTTIAKFTNYYFKKAQGSQGSCDFNTVICDVPILGYFTFERGIDEPKFDFIPTPILIQESGIMTDRKTLQISNYNEPVLRKELSVDRIASLSGLQPDVTNMILHEIVKQIVSYINFIWPTNLFYLFQRAYSSNNKRELHWILSSTTESSLC